MYRLMITIEPGAMVEVIGRPSGLKEQLHDIDGDGRRIEYVATADGPFLVALRSSGNLVATVAAGKA